MDNAKEIALRIAGLRDACGYTQQELADELGIDIDVYRSYEETGDDIPISTIFQIANKFGVDFTEVLTGNAAKLDTYHIVRSGQGKTVERYEGYNYQDLAFRYTHKIMQPLLVTLDPSDEPAALVTHVGQEFNLVLEGSVTVTFDDKEFTLGKGDSIYFNPTHPHGQRCAGNEPAVFVTIIAE
ncbi:MAG: XRE family transcriptional regulator [Oscillospiraceae bacterium]|jgi:mannose-6-phosphate isomerase-like protein (cupin superfamily)|nr:XRE family transcriptional regulator [Oscillospiraceae bacterium]